MRVVPTVVKLVLGRRDKKPFEWAKRHPHMRVPEVRRGHVEQKAECIDAKNATELLLHTARQQLHIHYAAVEQQNLRLKAEVAAAEAQLLLGEAIAAAGSRARRLAAGRFCYHCACTGGRANERAGSRLLVLTTTHVVCLSRSVGNSAELEWAEPLSAIATAEVAAEEPRTDVRLVVHLRDGGMRFVEGDARLRRSFVTKLASAIRALAAQPGS